jgi:hypothetical protein
VGIGRRFRALYAIERLVPDVQASPRWKVLLGLSHLDSTLEDMVLNTCLYQGICADQADREEARIR